MSKDITNKTKNRKHIRNSHLIEKIEYMGSENTPTQIHLIQYDQNHIQQKDIQITEKLPNLLKQDCINWFRVTGLTNADVISNICKSFGIPRFDIKDLLSAYHVTKVVEYERTTFMLMSSCYFDENQELKIYKNAFILGDNYIVSFQERLSPIFDDVIKAIEDGRVMIRENDEDYLLYILLNCFYSSFNDTTIKIMNRINDMEDLLINDDTENLNVMKFISERKKEISKLKRIVSPLREEYVNLLHNTNKLIKPESLRYFDDFDDRLRTVNEDLQSIRESISSLVDLYYNNNNLRMNNVIKKLTIISTIFIPMTFVAGVWGMNFELMPELKWKYGYIFAWGIMLAIGLSAVLYLKRKKWF